MKYCYLRPRRASTAMKTGNDEYGDDKFEEDVVTSPLQTVPPRRIVVPARTTTIATTTPDSENFDIAQLQIGKPKKDDNRKQLLSQQKKKWAQDAREKKLSDAQKKKDREARLAAVAQSQRNQVCKEF